MPGRADVGAERPVAEALAEAKDGGERWAGAAPDWPKGGADRTPPNWVQRPHLVAPERQFGASGAPGSLWCTRNGGLVRAPQRLPGSRTPNRGLPWAPAMAWLALSERLGSRTLGVWARSGHGRDQARPGRFGTDGAIITVCRLEVALGVGLPAMQDAHVFVWRTLNLEEVRWAPRSRSPKPCGR